MTPLELADRIEAATGPDRELDLAIERIVDLSAIHDDHLDRFPDSARPFTASLDAAMSLVPEGAGLSISRYWIRSVDGPVWAAEIATGGVPTNPRKVFDSYRRPSPALALCAAALRARALATPARLDTIPGEGK